MNNKHVYNKNKNIIIRVTNREHADIKYNAMKRGLTISAYTLYRLKHKPNIINISPKMLLDIQQGFNVFAENLDKFHSDYGRALANLNHDNYLLNTGQLSSIPSKKLRDVRNAVIKNNRELQRLKKQINVLEMRIWK